MLFIQNVKISYFCLFLNYSFILEKDKNEDFSPVVVQKVLNKPMYINYNQTFK